MKNTSFKFGSETIYPGESLTLALPLPQIFSCAPLYMPIKLIHGKQKGPTLLLIAAMYGNELNGTEIIQRLFNITSIAKLKGTLIAIPVMNVHGLMNRSRFLPEGINLNRHFPGNEHGTNAERIAHLFVQEVLSHADYCINLQSGPLNYYHHPVTRYYSENAATLEIARNFKTAMIIKSDVEPGSLQETALQQEKVFINYIAGEAMRFDFSAIRLGIHGILNVMRKLQMLPEKNRQVEKPDPTEINQLKWITASASGTYHSQIKLGQTIREGDFISVIKDPFGSNPSVDLRSPTEGIVVAKNNNPLIQEGDKLFQVAILSPAKPNTESSTEILQDNVELTQ